MEEKEKCPVCGIHVYPNESMVRDEPAFHSSTCGMKFTLLPLYFGGKAIEQAPTPVDWSAYRRECAKDFVAGLLADNEWASMDPQQIIGTAIIHADALVDALKKEK